MIVRHGVILWVQIMICGLRAWHLPLPDTQGKYKCSLVKWIWAEFSSKSLNRYGRIWNFGSWVKNLGNFEPWVYFRNYLSVVYSVLCYNWLRVTRIIIGSGNDLVPNKHQAITKTNDDLLSIGPTRTHFCETSIKIWYFPVRNMYFNMACKMVDISFWPHCVNTLRLRQNGRHFLDDIFKCISLNENFWILNKISLKYVPMALTDNMAV